MDRFTRLVCALIFQKWQRMRFNLSRCWQLSTTRNLS